MGSYQLALFPCFWLKGLEKWNLTVDLHTALKGGTGMSLWLSGQCLLLSLPVVCQMWRGRYEHVAASYSAQQVHPIIRERIRPSLWALDARWPLTQALDYIVNTNKTHQRSKEMHVCILYSAYFMDVKNQHFFCEIPLPPIAHICFLVNATERRRVALGFFLMGPSRPTIQAVQGKWAH